LCSEIEFCVVELSFVWLDFVLCIALVGHHTYINLLSLVCIILLLWKSLLFIAKAKEARIVYYNLLTIYSTSKIRIY
jgi:hypothetical protein